jgi:hypothetical protein
MNHILSIGISKHQNSFINNLGYAEKDASDFFNLFVENIGDIGYKKLLTDSEASLSNIRTALGKELQQSIKSGDNFFFFYSGHGATADDEDNKSLAHYLIPFDATLDIANSSISVTYLKQVFNSLETGANFIFIDSCFSGSLSSTKGYNNPNKKDIKQVKTILNTVTGNGNLIFTACRDNEEAIEDPESKNGLFTHFLLKDFLKKRTAEKFPITDILAPVSESVIEKAREKYSHTQTPTHNSSAEGVVYLPKFREKIKITPEMIEVPKYIELSSTAFLIPKIELEDKELEKLLNDTMDFVSESKNALEGSTSEMLFEKFVVSLIKKVKEEWEIIFENSKGVSDIPNSLAVLEVKNLQLFMMGAVISAFGSDRQMKIYCEQVVELLELTKNRGGLIALIAVPEMIIVELIYLIGVISLAKNNIKPFEILLKTRVWDYSGRDNKPEMLIYHTYIHYCRALGGTATKVNDHVREVLKSYKWIKELAPKAENKTDDLQLQVNFLLTILAKKYNRSIWADFGRWYSHRIMPLIQKLKYDEEMRTKIASLFDVKDTEIRDLISQLFSKVGREEFGGGGMFWESIEPEDLLTIEEKEELRRKNGENIN